MVNDFCSCRPGGLSPIPSAELALMIALHERRVLPTSGCFIRGLNGGPASSSLKWWRFQYSEYKASFSVQSPCFGSSVNNARDALRNSRLDTCAWT